MKINEIINETTSAGGIAGVVGGLGAGDPCASIYPAQGKKKKCKKKNAKAGNTFTTLMIKRTV